MKKYFCVETDELVDFGDILHLTFHKDLEDGKVTVEKDIPFTTESKDLLINLGFVEEREVEENNNDLLDFDEKQCEALGELIEDFEVLEQRVDKLEDELKDLSGKLSTACLEIQRFIYKQDNRSKKRNE